MNIQSESFRYASNGELMNSKIPTSDDLFVRQIISKAYEWAYNHLIFWYEMNHAKPIPKNSTNYTEKLNAFDF